MPPPVGQTPIDLLPPSTRRRSSRRARREARTRALRHQIAARLAEAGVRFRHVDTPSTATAVVYVIIGSWGSEHVPVAVASTPQRAMAIASAVNRINREAIGPRLSVSVEKWPLDDLADLWLWNAL